MRGRQGSGVGGQLVRGLEPGDHVAMLCEASYYTTRVGGLGHHQPITRQRGEALADLASIQGELADPFVVQYKQNLSKVATLQMSLHHDSYIVIAKAAAEM